MTKKHSVGNAVGIIYSMNVKCVGQNIQKMKNALNVIGIGVRVTIRANTAEVGQTAILAIIAIINLMTLRIVPNDF